MILSRFLKCLLGASFAPEIVLALVNQLVLIYRSQNRAENRRMIPLQTIMMTKVNVTRAAVVVLIVVTVAVAKCVMLNVEIHATRDVVRLVNFVVMGSVG